MEVWLTEGEVNTDIFLIFIIYIIKGFLLLLACDKYFLLDSYCNKDTVWGKSSCIYGRTAVNSSK